MISSLYLQWHWIVAPEGVVDGYDGSFCLCCHDGGEYLTNSLSVSLALLSLVALLELSCTWFGG